MPMNEQVTEAKEHAEVAETTEDTKITEETKTTKELKMFFLPIAFLYFEFLLRITTSQNLIRHLHYPLVFAISAGLFFAMLFSFLPVRAEKILTAILLGVTGVFFTVECMLKGNFQSYMDLQSVFSGAGNVVEDYGEDLFSAIFRGVFKILLFLLPMICYLILSFKHRVRESKPTESSVQPDKTELVTQEEKQEKPLQSGKLRFIRSMIGMSAAIGLYIIGSLFVHLGKESKFYGDNYDFNIAVETFGLFTGFRLNFRDVFAGKSGGGNFILDTTAKDSEITLPTVTQVQDTSSEDDIVTSIPSLTLTGDNVLAIDFDRIEQQNPSEIVADLNAYVKSLKPSNKNDYTGLFQGKNLILVCAEAFSHAAVSEELTPTLYRLTHNGIYFSEYYQPLWGGSTSTGEFSFLMGLVPHSGMTSMQKTKDNNNYFSLGNQLQRQGYQTCAYHNGDYDFYNRNLTHENLGYDHFIAYGSGLEDLVSEMKYCDSVLIDSTFDAHAKKQPFCLYYLTISGHSSYRETSGFVTLHYSKVASVFPDRYLDKTMYYLSYQYELEKALTLLVEKLEAAGIADDTVICLTADHYPFGLDKSEAFGNEINYAADLYGCDSWYPWDRDRNAWILWSGSLENELKEYACEVSTPTYSLDIVPTLSNLFGLPYDSRLLVGRDVFSEQMPLVVWNSHSWVTEAGYYNAGTGRFYAKEGYEYNKEYISQINNKVHNIVEFSYQVVDNDYYGILFGPDAETGHSGNKDTAATENGHDKNEDTAETETEHNKNTNTTETETKQIENQN